MREPCFWYLWSSLSLSHIPLKLVCVLGGEFRGEQLEKILIFPRLHVLFLIWSGFSLGYLAVRKKIQG